MQKELVKEGGCAVVQAVSQGEGCRPPTAHGRLPQLPASSGFSFCCGSCGLCLFDVKTIEIGPKQIQLSSSYT